MSTETLTEGRLWRYTKKIPWEDISTCLDGITDSMDLSLSKLQEMVEDRGMLMNMIKKKKNKNPITDIIPNDENTEDIPPKAKNKVKTF